MLRLNSKNYHFKLIFYNLFLLILLNPLMGFRFDGEKEGYILEYRQQSTGLQ
jgi:hypothetical protein